MKGGGGGGQAGGMAWTGTSLFAVSLPLKLDLNHQPASGSGNPG